MERNFVRDDAGYDLAASFQDSFNNLIDTVVGFLPELLAAILILIVGWILGAVLGKAVAKLFRTLKLDVALDKAGVDDLSHRAGYAFKPGKFAGGLVKWFIILLFTIVALNVLNLESVTTFMGEILAYLPKVLAAALILFVGLLAGNVLRSIVEGAVRSSQTISSDKASLIGKIAYYAVIVFAAMAALNQMQIAPELIQILFAGIVAASALAFGLAFGLGGRDAAKHYIARMDKKGTEMAKKEKEQNPRI
jgi:hypothetical protein